MARIKDKMGDPTYYQWFGLTGLDDRRIVEAEIVSALIVELTGQPAAVR